MPLWYRAFTQRRDLTKEKFFELQDVVESHTLEAKVGVSYVQGLAWVTEHNPITKIKVGGAEERAHSLEHSVLLMRTQVQFLVPTGWFVT